MDTTVSQDASAPSLYPRQSRPHLYELDPLRATTAVIVVAVHTLSFTVSLNQSTLGTRIQNAFIITPAN